MLDPAKDLFSFRILSGFEEELVFDTTYEFTLDEVQSLEKLPLTDALVTAVNIFHKKLATLVVEHKPLIIGSSVCKSSPDFGKLSIHLRS